MGWDWISGENCNGNWENATKSSPLVRKSRCSAAHLGTRTHILIWRRRSRWKCTCQINWKCTCQKTYGKLIFGIVFVFSSVYVFAIRFVCNLYSNLSVHRVRYCICIFICAHSQVEVGKGGFVRWVVRWVGEEEATSERVPEKKTLTLTPKLVPENNTSSINTGKSPCKKTPVTLTPERVPEKDTSDINAHFMISFSKKRFLSRRTYQCL